MTDQGYLKGKWRVGDHVIMYGGMGSTSQPIMTARIEKIYKTGHLVVGKRRFRPWSDDSAHETGDGYGRAVLRRATPERLAAVQKIARANKIRALGGWIARLDDNAANALPADAIDRLLKSKAASKEGGAT